MSPLQTLLLKTVGCMELTAKLHAGYRIRIKMGTTVKFSYTSGSIYDLPILNSLGCADPECMCGPMSSISYK